MSGIVYLVGAGPGDPGLMTRRSLELIARADAILYDRLIPLDALDGARPEADLRYVGKEPGAAAVTQEETNQLLVELARDPGVVVPKGQLAQRLEPLGEPLDFSALEVHVSNLRRKIGAGLVRTVRGVGYALSV